MKGVDNDQFGIFVAQTEIFNLFLNAAADAFCKGCKVDIGRSINCYVKQSALDSCKTVFKAKIQCSALLGFKNSKAFSPLANL
ncbi:MAG: hypothetical protein L6V93_03090 [Clostridiales bacterium]|nr:MAG: hypothetical protein L6V93_03090 [Clostridiales bacterium]